MSTSESVKKLRLGFTWAEGDRYSLSECALDPGATRHARCLEEHEFHHLPESVKFIVRERVLALFDAIPVEVLFVGEEPYNSCEEMTRDVRDKKVLRVRHRGHGPGIGPDFQKWRAVHDWFGHVQSSAPFTLSGELAAYARHVNQFPTIARPFVWSTVVLENAFRLNRGHWLCYPKNGPACASKLVFDVEWFGVQTPDEFYQKQLLNF